MVPVQWRGDAVTSPSSISTNQNHEWRAGLLEPNVNPITSLLRTWYTSMAFAQL